MARNGFTKKKVGSITLGERLQKLRSERRISLAEISKNTKIQVKYLEYLEQGNYEQLPPDVYVKGFLRDFAEFMGLDEQSLLKLYEKEKRIQENVNRGSKPEGKALSARVLPRFIVTPRMLMAALSIILFLGAGAYVYREIGKFSSVPRLIITAPEEKSEHNDNWVEVSGITDRDATLFINDQSVIVTDIGAFAENVSLRPGLNRIAVKAINRFNKETQKTIQVNNEKKAPAIAGAETEKVGEKITQEGNGENAQRNNLVLEISVTDFPTWMQVEADGNIVLSGILQPGEAKVFEAQERITLTSGKGSYTNIKFNGEDLGPLGGDPGVVKEVEFTKEGVKKTSEN